MKLIILILISFAFIASSYAQPIEYHKTISIPANDSDEIDLGAVYTDVVFFSASDSTTVKLSIDTTYEVTRVLKYSDGTQAAATLLDAGVYEIVDAVIRAVRFINKEATAKLIEIKGRREH